jgi:hypothetical protein
MFIRITQRAVVVVAGLAFEGGPALAQDDLPVQLVTIKSSGPHTVRAGDWLQARWVTSSVPVPPLGVRMLDVQVQGQSVRQMAVVIQEVCPPEPQPGGRTYMTLVESSFKRHRSDCRALPLVFGSRVVSGDVR